MNEPRVIESRVVIRTELVDDVITQSVDVMGNVMARTLDLREKHVRDLLIERGWVPPYQED